MRTWIDVRPSDWFYNEVMEASNYLLEDGQPLISGMTYNLFVSGKPYIYEEFVGSNGQTKFTLSKNIIPDSQNPLYVFIDGVQSIYKSCTTNASGTSDVELYAGVKQGQIVSFVSYGVPYTDPDWHRPETSSAGIYPTVAIPKGNYYYYDPFSRGRQEYLYAFGRTLRRANVRDEEWNIMTDQEIADKYIGLNNDVYCVNPITGTLICPFNLNGVTVKFNYWVNENWNIHLMSESLKPTSASVKFNNRFFPNAFITRAEAFAILNRLRMSFYSRFTDMDAPTGGIDQTIVSYQGQRVFRLNGNYPAGKGKLKVWVDGVLMTRGVDYDEFDNHTVLFKYNLEEGRSVTFYYKKTESDRFADVGKPAGYYYNHNGTTKTWDSNAWWAVHVMDFEDETFSNGELFVQGMEIKKFSAEGYAVVDKFGRPDNSITNGTPQLWFMPETAMTRAECVTILNRFRKWSIERFK